MKQKYAFGCAIHAGITGEPGHAYQMTRQGSLSARKSDTIVTDVVVPAIADYWDDLIAGDTVVKCVVKGDFDLGPITDELGDFVKRYGPIVGAIISLIA